MMIDVTSTYHGAELSHAGRSVLVPGAVGTQKTKSPLHRARDRLFNDSLARAWAHKIRVADTRYRIILKIPPDLVDQTNTP